jgi:hypothetical protein
MFRLPSTAFAPWIVLESDGALCPIVIKGSFIA